MNREALIHEFVHRYADQGETAEGVFLYYAPGRVNLIGEHIDYSGGLVFPCALDFGTYGAVRLREDRKVRLSSRDFTKEITADLSDIRFIETDGWTNYPKGVIKEFLERGFDLQGFDLLISGEIPSGSGLSSSASVEMLTAYMLNDLFGCGLTLPEMALLCQHSENVFNGVSCGIMDQFAVGMGRSGQGILLDCASLEYRYVPLALEDAVIVIGNTKKRRSLSDSKYNERRSECEEALRDLQSSMLRDKPLKDLCELSVEEFEASSHLIPREIPRKRARHAVYENARVKEAARVLEAGDVAAFGRLMNASHDSLRDLYEVTGPELDAMVEEARSLPETIGSRMTGAGFGGCTVSLVKKDQAEHFIREVSERYERRTGLKGEFYVARPGDGPRRIEGKTPETVRDVTFYVEALLCFGLEKGLIGKADISFVRNGILDILGVEEPAKGGALDEPPSEAFAYMLSVTRGLSPEPILRYLLDYAAEKGILEGNTLTHRDLLDARIMGLFLPRPSDVDRHFEALRRKDPMRATDYFYQISRASHYIMEERTEKNLSWLHPSSYGDMEITINLSKPEKDPRVIARLKDQAPKEYPKCLLCHENVGFPGNLHHPARQNLRQISLTLQEEPWYLQYSPYTYYPEHCILLKAEHVPMQVSEVTFRRLFEFVDLLPHYFMGSNAGLPVVGGSILSHEHYQGGHHTFPMEKASVRQTYEHRGYPGVSVSVINWAMAGIRLKSKEKETLMSLASHVLRFWEKYSDERVGILCETEKGRHNAITPIARRNAAGEYELDMIFRNNRTSEEFPDGIFHPHPERHHIKKENIGLIEVMGLAVLPGRLEKELGLITELLLGRKEEGFSAAQRESLEKHQPWIRELLRRKGAQKNREDAEKILKSEVGEIFVKVLEDASVFKTSAEGITAFDRFLLSAGFLRN